jgi:hypothetical protein
MCTDLSQYRTRDGDHGCLPGDAQQSLIMPMMMTCCITATIVGGVGDESLQARQSGSVLELS